MAARAQSPTRHPQSTNPVLRRWPTIVTVIALLAVWQLWVQLAHPPTTLIASPTQIVAAMARTWPTLWPASCVTFLEGLGGFLIACVLGVLLGVGLYCSRTAEAALMPLLTAAQTLPLISIAPLFLIWFGFERAGKVVIVAIFALFPIVVQTIRGLDAVPAFYADVAMTCGASRAWTLFHVKLRVAARQVFGGVRVAAAYVFATAATAEYLGARQGLGIWLQAAYNSFQTPLIFAATIMIVLMTGVLMLAVHAAERLVLGPADDAVELDQN
ncbi:MAG: ABC transporter permease subunit [Bifidobacterium sp.]|nr:ABC transporter permease subunit [Bifidobacterium sp.]